jgi:hypothetical protein
MNKLDISDEFIGAVIQRVCPLVEQETGWALQPTTLRWRVLPKERGYEEILQRRLRSAGVAMDENAPRSLLERLVELTLEANILAAYDPGSQTIFIIRENVDESNPQGISVILAHELVHRGQHLHHPELFSQADVVIRSVYDELESGEFESKRAIEKIESMQATMTLIESHAAYVQQQIAHKYYPEAQIETHFNLLTLLFSLLFGVKTAQYTGSLPEIARASANGEMDNLYRTYLS